MPPLALLGYATDFVQYYSEKSDTESLIKLGLIIAYRSNYKKKEIRNNFN